MIPRLVLDARKLGDTGIGVYLENLVCGLLELKQAGELSLEISLLVGKDFFAEQVSDALGEIRQIISGEVELVLEPSGKYSFSEYFGLAFRQRELLKRSHIFHSPHYTLPFLFRAFSGSIPSVVTVHDLIHVTNSEHLGHKLLAPLLVRSALSRASRVIAVSRATKSSLLRFSEGEGVRVSVVPNAVQSGIEPLDSSLAETLVRENFPELVRGDGVKKFLLFVGTERPHKGFDLLLRAWSGVVSAKASAEQRPLLVVVGSRFGDETKRAAREAGLGPNLCFLGNVSRKALNALYNSAQALVVPSRQEGFGLPLLEAMAVSLPTICTPLPSFREICGDYAIFSSKLDPVSLEDAILRFFENEELFRMAAHSGPSRARAYSRMEVARETCEVYRQVLRETSSVDLFLKTAAHPEEVLPQEVGARE